LEDRVFENKREFPACIIIEDGQYKAGKKVLSPEDIKRLRKSKEKHLFLYVNDVNNEFKQK